MKKEEIGKFLQKDNMEGMHPFFLKLKEEEWDVLFLVTRKGFWLYLLMQDEFEDAKITGRKVFSDRYLLKAQDLSIVRGKTVYLVDDTMSRGNMLFRYFCILEMEGAKRVIPAVYSLSIEFHDKGLYESLYQIYYRVHGIEEGEETEKDKLLAEETRKKFNRNLYCQQYLKQEEISTFCLAETELFQKMLCPMVIDLPMLVAKKKGGNILKDNFLLKEQEFHKLTQGSKDWKYVRNVYGEDASPQTGSYVKSYLDTPIQCNYFEYHDQWTESLEGSILHNMVVKCKFNIDEGGKYHIIFTPFAIVQSCQKDTLKQIFRKLFENTDYGKDLLKEIEEKDSENIWISAFRAVIFALSLYVGDKFISYMKDLGIQEVGYDWEIMKMNSEPIFIEAMKQVKGVEVCERISDVLFEGQRNINKNRTVEKVIEKYSLERAYEDIRMWIVEKENIDILSFEDIEEMLSSQYSFSDDSQRRRGITSVILLALETSICSNFIKVSQNKVVRGFRHGENSKLLVTDTGIMCYACAEALYICVGEENYEIKVDNFFRDIRNYMEDNGYFKYFSKKDFERCSLYFRKKREGLRCEMRAKHYLLNRLDDNSKIIQTYAINKAEGLAEEVQKWEREKIVIGNKKSVF